VSARCVNADLKIAAEQCRDPSSTRVYESPKPARVARRGVSPRGDTRAAEGAHLRSESGPGIIPARVARNVLQVMGSVMPVGAPRLPAD
jgi:hypothetical protein